MRKVYLDMTQAAGSIGAIGLDAQIIGAGTTVYSMPIKEKNDAYQRYADDCDIHFIFDDNLPALTFYTVPWVDILATDGDGGFIGTVGAQSDLQSDAPICYIDSRQNCFLIAQSGKAFLEIADSWKRRLKPYEGIVFYSAKARGPRGAGVYCPSGKRDLRKNVSLMKL